MACYYIDCNEDDKLISEGKKERRKETIKNDTIWLLKSNDIEMKICVKYEVNKCE